MAEAAPFLWGGGNERLSPDAIKRRRAVAAAMLKGGMDYSPVGHWTQGLSRVAQALVGGYEEGKLDSAEKLNTAEDAKTSAALVSQLLGGGATPVAGAPTIPASAPSMAGAGATRAMAMPSIAPEIKEGIVQTANALGISPVDLATTISYETGGTFDPTKKGPVTKWGQHAGLIQFGEPQAKQHGVDWANPVASQLGANGAVASYLKTAGVKPGMGLLDIYSAINAGAPGLYNRSDTAAGGAPGTVRDKVEKQMAGHRAKAQALFADLPAPGASPVAAETGQPGFAIPQGQPQGMDQQTFNAIQGNEIVPPVFQSEGVGQPWMGTAMPPAAPQTASTPLPPPRPSDLVAPGAAQANLPGAGNEYFVPPAAQQQPEEDLSNTPDAGMRQLQVLSEQARQGQPAATREAASPLARVAQVLGAGSPQAAPAAAQSPAVSQVAQAIASSPNDNALASALVSQNPALQRIAQAVLTNRVEGSRGVVMGDRLVNPRNGAIIADYTQLNGGRSNKFGLTPIYGTRNGKTVMLQAGERGDVVETKLPEGVELPTGVERVDLGTSIGLLDKRTGQMVGAIPKDLAGAERAKVEGKAQGEAATGLTGAIAQAENVLKTIDQVRTHPGRNQFGATGAGSTLPLVGDGLPGTKGRDFVGLVDQLKGQAFLDAFDALRGGGAISEAEGKVATQARARLDRAQSKEGFDAALKDLEDIVKLGVSRARQKAGQSAAPTAPAAGGWNEVAPGVRIREKR